MGRSSGVGFRAVGQRRLHAGTVFAARSARRPRLIATAVALAAVGLLAYAGCVIWSAMAGPDAPGLDLPSFEQYGGRAPAAKPTLPIPYSHSTMLVVGLVGLVIALGSWRWLRMGRRRPEHVTVTPNAVAGAGGDRRSRRTSRRVGRWWVAAMVISLATLVIALDAHGYTANAVASDHHVADGNPALAAGTGSIIDIGPRSVSSVHPRPGHVALTFDDGPDPRWTPAILNVLDAEHVPGTFFVIGEHVVAHPGLVRRVLIDGGEIGVHTYRHLEISGQAPADFQRDLRLTQLAIVGATGRGTSLFRPPFITDRSNVGLRQYVALEHAGEDGYVIVLADKDSTDWSNPGVAIIALRSMPDPAQGAIVEMHDGGGDRAQTVAALRLVIRELKRRGYQFDTVSGIARLPASSRMPERALVDRMWGRAFLWSMGIAGWATPWFEILVLAIALLTILRMTLVIVGGLRSRRASPTSVPRTDPSELPTVSVLVAAFNEALSLPATLAALCRQRGNELQIVVVDDGSTDATASVVSAFADSRVVLVSIDHAGKAAALAAGLAHCSGEIVATVDADTQLAPEALMALVRPFLDDAVGGVSGNLRVARPKGLLGAAQHLEYIVGNAFDRRALGRIGIQVTVPGAAGAFRRSALDAVGGFDGATVAEDTDLTLALVDAGWDVVFAPDAIASTTTPTTIASLWRQRSRWSFGIAQAVWRRRSMVRNPRRRPRVAAAWIFAVLTQLLLPIAAPLLDLAALWAIFSGARLPIVLWLGVGLFQLMAAAIALHIEGESRKWLWVLPLHLFGYRQITSFVVAQAVAWAAAGRQPGWGMHDRVPRVRKAQVAAPAARRPKREGVDVGVDRTPIERAA